MSGHHCPMTGRSSMESVRQWHSLDFALDLSNGLDPEVTCFVEGWIVNGIVLVLLLLENHGSLETPMNIKQL